MKSRSFIRQVCQSECSKFLVKLIIFSRTSVLKSTKLGNVWLCKEVMVLIEQNIVYHFDGNGIDCLNECNEERRCVILRCCLNNKVLTNGW